MGHVRSNCPEVVATGPMLIKCGTSLGRPLLRSVFVPDHNCVTEEVDLTKEDIRMVERRMYQQHHKFYGAFVAKLKEPLPSLPVSTLHHLMVSVRDQHISARKTLGSFRMANSQGTTQRCSDFIREAQRSCCKP